MKTLKFEETKNVAQTITTNGGAPASLNAPAASDLAAEWLCHLESAVHPANRLADVNIPKPEPILGEWWREGDLGFIFGPRGLGKTWLAMLFARRVAEAVSVAEWTTLKPWPVLYVDGEMSFADLRERDAMLSGAPGAPVSFLNHEALFHSTEKTLNLAVPAIQKALLDLCLKQGFKVLVLDNLSCLFSGIAENEADSWELVLPWLLTLRRHRISVLIVHHAGRNAQHMRGTTKREDAAAWVLKLSEPKSEAEPVNGACFVVEFDKNRHATAEHCPPLEWTFRQASSGGSFRVNWRRFTPLQVFRQWVDAGLTGAKDIAEEMGVSKGYVSKLAKRAMAEGWLVKDGYAYKLVS